MDRGTHDVMVINKGNGHGKLGANPGWKLIIFSHSAFTLRKYMDSTILSTGNGYIVGQTRLFKLDMATGLEGIKTC